MFVEGLYYAGYYMLMASAFGLGLEFIAIKLGKTPDRGIVRAFLSSWELGFLISAIFVLFDFAPIYVRDFMFFLGLGIALPDVPVALKKYWKYIVAIATLLKLPFPSWVIAFLDELYKLRESKPSGEKEEAEPEEEVSCGEENIEWGEPEYVK